MLLDIFFMVLIIIGLSCVLVTKDYAKEVNIKVNKEIQK
jgi:hypothetical protein